MIKETEIYGDVDSLFKTTLLKDNVMNVYHVSPNYGNDLNTNNLESFFKDEKYGISTINPKYPICVCMTPRSILQGDFERFTFNLFFLKKSKIEDVDKDTNVSMQLIEEDWSNMKASARLFLSNLKVVLQGYYNDDEVLWHNVFSLLFSDPITITRVANVGVDKVSGVGITFNAFFNENIC